MAWTMNDAPLTRAHGRKASPQAAYDPVSDTSNRMDSVFDAYANIFADYGMEDEEEEPPASSPSPVGSGRHAAANIELSGQRTEPWDTRGKTGLYGGGGRGANDSETGWVREYSVVNSEQTYGGGAEEDLHYREESNGRNDRTTSRRRSSSGTDHSSYGPVTPVTSTFEPSLHQHQDPFRKPSAPHNPPFRPSRPTEPEQHRYFTDETNGDPSQPPHFGTSAKAPNARFASPIVVNERPERPTAPPRAENVARLRRKNSMAGGAAPNISAPVSVAPQTILPAGAYIDIATGSPGSAGPVGTHNSGGIPVELKRRKSFSASLKWNRVKKPPVISNPILPDGFVESLGMETFALNTAANAAQEQAERAKGHKKEKEGGKSSRKSPTPVIVRQPELVRTPLDALRDVGANAPASNVELRKEVSDAFRRLSKGSDFSSAPSTIAPGELERRGYPQQVTAAPEGQPSWPSSLPSSTQPGYSQQRRGSAATTKQSHYSPARPAVPPTPQSYAIARQSPPNLSKEVDSLPDARNGGRPSVDSVGTTNSSNSNYLTTYMSDNDGYSVQESPDNASEHSMFSLDDRAGDASDYSQASPMQESLQYGTFTEAFRGQNYTSIYSPSPVLSEATKPLKVRRSSSEDRGFSSGGSWSSNAKPSYAPPATFQIMGQESLFRNPFQATTATAGGGGPRQSGWQ